MNSRLRWIVVAILVAFVAHAGTASALEKVRERWDGTEHSDDWRAVGTCSVAYYNICSGYVWVWSGWEAESRFGTSVDACCGPTETANLMDIWFYFRTGSPPGYGFTGSFDAWTPDVDGNPTGAALVSQSHLPVSGWNNVVFNGGTGAVVPSTFLVTYTSGAAALPDPMAVFTDMPAMDMGTCYPTTRTTQSYTWGTASIPAAGSPFFDDTGNAELLLSATIECTVSIDDTSWGNVKALYR